MGGELKEAQRVANVGHWQWVAQTDAFTCSEEFSRIAGRDPEGPTPHYKDGPQVFTPESWASLEPAIQRTLQTGMPCDLDLEIVRPDGTRRCITVRGEALTNATEEIVGLRGTAQDITERKRLEQDQAWLGAIVDGSQDAIVGTTPEGTITSWNQGALRIFGYTPDEILGKSVLVLIPSERLEEEEQIRAQVQQNERVEHYETVRRHKDGRLIDASLTISPIRDGSGRLIGASTIAQDITERERAEEINRRYSVIIVSSDDAIISKTLDGIVTSWNPGAERLFGYTEHETVGEPISMLIPPERADEESENMARLQRGERVEHFETTRVCKDGKNIDVSVSISPITDASGKIIGASKIAHDITTRKRAEEEIRQLNTGLEQRVNERTAQLLERTRQLEVAVKEIEAFSYTVSHDLRAPIRAMDGYSRILLEDYGEKVDEEGRRSLKFVRSEAKRMGNLVDDLLAFSRLSRQPMVSADVDMTALAKSVFDSLAALERDRELQLALRPLPAIQGELAMLRQVWVNLLGNAIKFTKGRKVARIEIGAENGAEEQIYYVKDNGAGFDMRFVGKLFGVFQRLHTDQEFPGTGVGLAIVQRIITRHSGRAWAEGKVNEGATIYFAIPKAKI